MKKFLAIVISLTVATASLVGAGASSSSAGHKDVSIHTVNGDCQNSGDHAFARLFKFFRGNDSAAADCDTQSAEDSTESLTEEEASSTQRSSCKGWLSRLLGSLFGKKTGSASSKPSGGTSSTGSASSKPSGGTTSTGSASSKPSGGTSSAGSASSKPSGGTSSTGSASSKPSGGTSSTGSASSKPSGGTSSTGSASSKPSGGTSSNVSSATSSTVPNESVTAEVLRLCNQERAKAGLSPLKAGNAALDRAAQTRAAEITRQFSHTRPDGSSCFTTLEEQRVGYSAAGENIAYGQRTPAQVVNAWMNSTGHRANILNANFDTLSVGHVAVGNTHYWAQLFIKAR